MKVIGTRGLGFLTCLRIQPYRLPIVTFPFPLLSIFPPPLSRPLIICTAYTFFFFFFVAVLPRSTLFFYFFLTSSPSCHNKPKKIGGSTLGTLSSNSVLGSVLQHFKHTLTVPVITVPAAIGRYSQTSYSLKLASDKMNSPDVITIDPRALACTHTHQYVCLHAPLNHKHSPG